MVSNPLTDRMLGFVTCRAGESTMLIVCPSCSTSYNLEPSALAAGGRQVRCVRCRTVWHADPAQAEQQARDAAAAAPTQPDLPAAMAAIDQVEWQKEAGEIAPTEAGANPPLPPAGDTPVPDAAAAEPSAVEVEAPPLVPAESASDRAPIEIEVSQAEARAAAEPQDIETYAARRARDERRRLLRWPLSLLQSIALVLLIIDAVLIGWRNDLVRLLPQTASFYTTLGLSVNLRGISFTDVSTVTEQHDGVPILVVEGSIVNDTRKFVDVPRLKFAVRNAAGEEIYSWTAVAPRPTLAPGGSVPFRSRLASLPPDGHDLLVRFVTRQDLVGGGG